jgi:hypothetical protein
MAGAGAVAAFWRPVSGGVSVAVKVQPKARRPGVSGPVAAADGPRLRIAVSEPAEDGRANRAACATLAAALGVAASAVSVTAGASSRQKLLHVSGDAGQLAPRLEAL